MRDAPRRVRVVAVSDVVEEDHRVVLRRVLAGPSERTDVAIDVLLVRLPRNVRSFQLGDQMIRNGAVIRGPATEPLFQLTTTFDQATGTLTVE